MCVCVCSDGGGQIRVNPKVDVNNEAPESKAAIILPLQRRLSLSQSARPPQVLQAMGYPTGFDSDLDPMSSDEKSDGEGKSETSLHTSNNPTHSSDSSNTLEVCVCVWGGVN